MLSIAMLRNARRLEEQSYSPSDERCDVPLVRGSVVQLNKEDDHADDNKNESGKGERSGVCR